MVDKNDSLLREVDEELRREQLEKLWQKYGTYAFIVAALIVVGVGGTKWLEARRLAAAEKAGAAYQQAVAALATGKSEDAAKALNALSADGPAGYAQLAELQLAGTALKSGNPAEALKIYERLGSERSSDRLLQGFAKLQAASIRMADADFTEMQNRLNDLIVAESPWRANAGELLGLAAMKAGKTDDARKAFERVMGERNAPQSVIERTRTFMGNLIAGELAKPKPAEGSQTKAPPDKSADMPKPEVPKAADTKPTEPAKKQ